MAEKIVKKSGLDDLLKSLAESYTVFVPKTDGQAVSFGPLEDEVLLDFQNSRMSPKDFFFPQSERMFEYVTDPASEEANILKSCLKEPESRLIFGIRPCDAKAFMVLDKIFTNDQYEDVFWTTKRDASVVVGLGCNNPCPACFCTSVGTGPFHEEGLDILVYDLGEDLLLKPVTGQGEQVLEQAGGLTDADDKALKAGADLKTGAEAAIASHVETDNIEEREVMELFEAEHWEKVQERCLNCGVCTYVCPTCHCFDIQDEVAGDVGDRIRNWDSCMSWLFTAHGTGHNPRPNKMSRVRQRFMHKFKYIPVKRDGDIGCVGCGRCIVSCPVNIDVRDVVRDMNTSGLSGRL